MLDPAVGDGELLLALVERLGPSLRPRLRIVGFDTSEEAVRNAQQRLNATFPALNVDLRHGDFLEFVLGSHGGAGGRELFGDSAPEQYDLVISNPPYVRTQVMGSTRAQRIARQFGLSGRVDLYHAFIQAIAKVVSPEGIVGLIVSNRFMTTRSGAAVRKSIASDFGILHVWDLGDTRLFEAAVLPAVLLLVKRTSDAESVRPRFTSIYSTTESSNGMPCAHPIAGLTADGLVCTPDGMRFVVQHGHLDYGDDPGDVWRLATDAVDRWLATVEANTHCTFGDIGKVRVGIKTTADRVFIRSDWDDLPECERPELLRPLITHHIARRFRAISAKQQRQVLYTHQVIQGKRVAVDIGAYPQAERYLSRHRGTLEGA